MRTTIFFIFLFFCAVRVAAQDGAAAGRDTIAYSKGSDRFTMAGRRLHYPELKTMLQANPASAAEFARFRKQAVPGNILLLTGITAGIIAFTQMKKDTRFFTPFTITLFAGDLLGIPLMISANKHLKRSVKRYNAALLQ